MNSVVIIGSGNVATYLGKAFQQAGLDIRAVCSPTLSHAQFLAEKLKTIAISGFHQVPSDADVYLLAVKDSAIKEASDKLNVNGIVLHCSGMTNIDVLDKHKGRGVMWPLQTLTKNTKTDIRTVPICVEGNNEAITAKIQLLAKKMSDHVVVMATEQRQYTHLAAVFANNFSNHLFDIAAQILSKKGISFGLIRPLISETASKIQQALPSENQTGPAKRNDINTIEQHIHLLENYPDFRQLYEALTSSIRKQNK